MFTLRELYWMSEGRQKLEWEIASSLMALNANLHRMKPPWAQAADYNPFAKKSSKSGVTLRDFGEAVIQLYRR